MHDIQAQARQNAWEPELFTEQLIARWADYCFKGLLKRHEIGMYFVRIEKYVAKSRFGFWQKKELLCCFCCVAENTGWTTPDACQVDAYVEWFHYLQPFGYFMLS